MTAILIKFLYLNLSLCYGCCLKFFVMVKWIFLLSVISFGIFYPALANQPDSVIQSETQDDIYFTDLSDLLALRFYTITKSNRLEIYNGNDKVVLKPNGRTNLGVGFNYKSLGLGIAFGFPQSQTSNNKYVKTKRFDFQFSVFSKTLGIDGFFQIYQGYYNSNPNDFVEWNEDYFPKLEDLRILSLGISAFYILNEKRFSYKAAFVRNQIQNKSAGSLTLGIFSFYDESKTDNGFIPQEYPDSIKIEFDLKAFTSYSMGISIGYMYTIVFRIPFFINMAVIPGFGFKRVSFTNLSGENDSGNQPTGQLLGRLAIGYEHPKFYAGATASTILRGIKYKEFEIDLATEQFRVFIGKRFDISPRKKK